MAGRGAKEKAIAELESGFSFDTVPTADYAASTVWQHVSMLADNLMRNVQMEAGAENSGRKRKRTPRPVIKTIRTLRFEVLHRASRLVRPSGRCIRRSKCV